MYFVTCSYPEPVVPDRDAVEPSRTTQPDPEGSSSSRMMDNAKSPEEEQTQVSISVETLNESSAS